jgi:hypothetical protein
MVYADHLQRVVLFGGLTDPDAANIRYELGDTWEWSGTRWVQIFTAQSPAARSGPGMAYDSLRRQVILFGGLQGRNNFFNDTWAYRNREWVQIATPNAPAPRTLPGMAYDAVRDRVVMHGGADASGVLRDTWEFDGTTWTRRSENGPALVGLSMVYDAARNRILMIGLTSGTPGQPEMYAWNGASWERLNPASMPQCVGFGGLAFQEHNQRVLFTGGQCGNGLTDALTWEWDGNDWTDLKPGLSPGEIVGPAIAYDRLRENVVLFGGDSGFGVTGTTFLFKAAWRPVGDISAPGTRSLPVFEYDPVRNVSWLFGGRSAPGEWGDLWMLSDNVWQQVRAENTPSACLNATGTWDPDRNRLVVICADTAVYEWDGEAWHAFTSQSEQPAPRRWSSVTYDPKSRSTLLFGGFTDTNLYSRELWSWNGSRWTRLAKDAKTYPPNRALGSMFWDPVGNRILLFGGIGRNNATGTINRYGDMWSWDGQNWIEVTNVTLPTARYGAKTALNPVTRRVMLFGGKSDQEKYLNDQWEWDGSSWRQVTLSNPPAPRMNHGLLYDQALQRFVMYGGYAGLYYGELWRFDGTSWSIQQNPTGRRRGVTLSPAAGTMGITAGRIAQ